MIELRQTYLRPKDLEPEIARNRVTKKVAMRLKIKRTDAAELIEWADQRAGLEFKPERSLAVSNQNTDLGKAEIAQIKAYWSAIETDAIEQAEEDEEILLWC